MYKQESRNFIRLAGKFKTVDELRNLVISNTPLGGQVRLAEVADVQDAQKDVEKLARVNRQAAIVLQVVKQSDANGVSVSEGVQETVEKLRNEYVSIDLGLVIANDASVYTLESNT